MLENQRNGFELLKNRKIIDILIGDIEFDDGSSMPYWSGSELRGLSTTFGLDPERGSKSRWMYLENLLYHCVQKGTMPGLLEYLFQKEQFIEKLRGLSRSQIEENYPNITKKAIEQINDILYFSDKELVKLGSRFGIQKIGTSVKIEAPVIKVIDNTYIQDLSKRALKDISNSEFDSAITKSRTLLEEVFCYVIEKRGELPSEKGDIRKLYNQVKSLYNMHQDKSTDNRINSLLSGLEKIVTSVSEMRNNSSDAHGVGNRRIGIKDYHARLFVNSATSMSEFILSVEQSFTEMKQ